MTGIPTIISYNDSICNSTFTVIITDKGDRLDGLLPAAHLLVPIPQASIGTLQLPSGILVILEIHSLCPPV